LSEEIGALGACFADGYYGTLKMPSMVLLIPLILVLE
jgi:hypothetical protein